MFSVPRNTIRHREQICDPEVPCFDFPGDFLMGRKFFIKYPHGMEATTSAAVGVPAELRIVIITLDHAASVFALDFMAKNLAFSI